MINTVFLTQAGSLRVFADVRHSLVRKTELGRVGFYVADSSHYLNFVARNPDFEASVDVVKEWDILFRAKHATEIRRRVADIERRYGETLWNAIVADRRLYLGRNAVREQDYSSRYSHDELLAIAVTAVDAIESLFDRVRPDLVVGFICVTIGEYLSHLVARDRGVRFVNLRPTRLRNYFYGGEDIFEPSAALSHTYRHFLAGGVPEERLAVSRDILRSVRDAHAMYEGVTPAVNQLAGASAAAEKRPETIEPATARLSRILREGRQYRAGPLAADNHRPDKISAHVFHKIKKPWRRRMMAKTIGRRYVRNLAALSDNGYAFFPMHKEPEVTLLVYGRPWLNQIEAVRIFALSLPLGVKLVVKEHPAAVGYRPVSYYRKLLEIPNVLLAPPEYTSREVLRHARLVTIIGGSVGLEGLIVGKPVVALGNVPFAFLPEAMIRTARDVRSLGSEIRDLLATYRTDETALEAYVAAVVAGSVPVDFYSVLLNRNNAYRPDTSSDSYSVQINRLSEYILSRFQSSAVTDNGGDVLPACSSEESSRSLQ